MDLSNIKKEDYCFKSNYPKIEKNIKEENALKQIIDVYSGPKGELTAFFQYLYESLYTKLEHKELSEIFENICMAKLEHIEILSQLLISMGMNPKFCKYIDNNQNICNYWSTGSVKYLSDISKFIDYNIKFEEYTINEYKDLLKSVKNPSVIDIINLILKDEEAYIVVFKQIKEIINDDANSCYDDTDNLDIKSKSSNNNKEIVNILSSSQKNIEIIENLKPNINTPNKTCTLNETIKIPIRDLNAFSNKEISYLNKLEKKIYSPDEIIDG